MQAFLRIRELRGGLLVVHKQTHESTLQFSDPSRQLAQSVWDSCYLGALVFLLAGPSSRICLSISRFFSEGNPLRQQDDRKRLHYSTEWTKFGKIVFEVFLTVSFKLSPDFGEADSFGRDMKEELLQYESTEREK